VAVPRYISSTGGVTLGVHKPFRRARELGVIAFSTPFDSTAWTFWKAWMCVLQDCIFREHRLATDPRVATTGKPLIISTGMATVGELDETVRAARESGCNDLILLKCTSTYPATADNTTL